MKMNLITKINLSYYNSYRVNKMPEEIKKNYEYLRMDCCKSENDIKKIGLKNKKIDLIYENFIQRNYKNGLQIVLLDLQNLK